MSLPDLLPKSKEIKNEVLKSFGRTPESLKADIESLKEWAKKQPHLPQIPSDNYITSFLLSSKFEFAKAKRMIDVYYTLRGIAPEFYKDPEAPEVLKIMDLIYWIPIPKVTPSNCRIIVTKLRKRSEDHHFDSEAYFSYIVNFVEILFIEDPGSAKIFFFDGANIQLEHISSISPLMAKKFYHGFEKMQAHQIYQVHLYNLPAVMEPLLILTKSIMKPKFAEKVHIHRNIESVFEYIPKENLPQDYGGEEQSLETLFGLWKIKAMEYAPLIRKQNLLRTDESKRLEECSLDSEFLGLEGNFRKLNVD